MEPVTGLATQDVEAPDRSVVLSEETALLSGSNEPQSSNQISRKAAKYAIITVITVIILGCIDLFLIVRSKPTFHFDSANLSLETTPSADASLTMQGQIGSSSVFHSVEVGSSACEVKYDELGVRGEWRDMLSIEGSASSTGAGTELVFRFQRTEFSALRHFLYDAVWSRPTGASVRCAVNVNVYMYRFVPVPFALEIETTAAAPTSEKASVSFASSAAWAGRTLFDSYSVTEFNRTQISPQGLWASLQTMHAHAAAHQQDARDLATSFLSMFNHSSPKELPLNISIVNPFLHGETAPLSSLVIAVPKITVAATTVGDVEDGGRLFLSSSAFQLDLMQPALRLATELSLQCSDTFSTDEAVPLTHCSMPGPEQSWNFLKTLLNGRFHFAADSVTTNFVTSLAGHHHSLTAELTNSTQTDTALRQRLAAIEKRADPAATPTSAALTPYKAKKEDTDIHFMGYGVSTHGSCIIVDADNVFQLLGCASLRSGRMKFRMHLLNEEGVLVAAALRNTWATESTAEIRTQISATLDRSQFMSWNSTISESQHMSVFDFAYLDKDEPRVQADIRVDWNLTNDNSRKNALVMRGHIIDQLITGDDDLNLVADLHYGMNAFFCKMSASDLTADAFGSYDFSKHLTFGLSVDKAAVYLNGTEFGHVGVMLESTRLPGSADGLNHTADMRAAVLVSDQHGNETFEMQSTGQYGLVWESRFLDIRNFFIAVEGDPLCTVEFAGHADKAGSSGLHAVLRDGDAAMVVETDNLITWEKADNHTWDQSGHLALASTLNAVGNFSWDTHAKLDYEDNAFDAMVVDHSDEESDLFMAHGKGTFGERNHLWWFTASEAGLSVMNDQIGGAAWAIVVDKTRSTDIHVQISDHNDTTVMHTHTALNWSDPADYGTDVHLSLASTTDFFGILDWDAEATVDYTEPQYSVRIEDRALAGDEILRVIADGDLTKTEHTMLFHVQELVLYAGGDRLIGLSSYIELDEQGSFVIGAKVRDGNDTQIIMSDNRVMWRTGDADKNWDEEGHVRVRSHGNLFDSVLWYAQTDVDYANSTYTGRVSLEGDEGEEILLVDGIGHYGRGEKFWMWSAEEVVLFLGASKVGSVASAIDYHASERSGVSFQLTVSDADDKEVVMTNSSVRWSKQHHATWEKAGQITVESVFDPHRARFYRRPRNDSMDGNFTSEMNGTVTATHHAHTRSSKLSALAAASPTCFPGQTDLNLAFQGLITLPDLSSCTGLLTLDISGNDLTSLDPAIFDILGLQELRVGHNYLDVIAPEIAILGKLRTLDLSHNQLSDLPSELCDLPELVELGLQYNNLSRLPANIGDLSSLQHIDISANHISALPESLSNLRGLVRLHAEANMLTQLPIGLGQLSSLRECYLDKNQLASLPDNIGDLQQLTILSVRSNRLQSLNGSIGELGALESLYLDHNSLYYLPDEITDLGNLLELTLDDNGLYGFPWQLSNLHRLQLLSANENNLGYLNYEIGFLRELLFLYVRGNHISDIPSSFEDLRKLRELDISNNTVEFIPQFLFELPDLQVFHYDGAPNFRCNGETTSMDMSYANLYLFNFPDLSQCGNITEMYLSGNQLEEIPETIFRLKKLQVLDMSDNDLLDVPWEIEALHELVDLVLDDNMLEYLPDELCGLQSLKLLSVDRNDLLQLPDCLGGLQRLTSLYVASNYLTHLPPQFSQLQELESLDISGNNFDQLPFDIGGLTNLQRLRATYNELSSLPQSIGNLRSLTSLDLDSNHLTTLPISIGDLSRLEELSVRYNDLLALPSEIGQLSNMTGLYLTNNELKSLPPTMGMMHALHHLDVSWNHLVAFPVELYSLAAVSDLDLSGNQFDTLPAELGNLQQLYFLDASYNRIAVLPETIGQLQSLRTLSVSGNGLVDLPSALFALVHLQYLHLGNNRLRKIPSEVENLQNLYILYLWDNELEDLPAEFASLPLDGVHISNNLFSKIPACLFNMTGLYSLDMSWNRLEYIPWEISEVHSLHRLYLSGNKLSSFPDSVAYVSKIYHLQLSYNQFYYIPYSVCMMPELSYLSMRNNFITDLPEYLLALQDTLEELDLSQNQIYELPPFIGNLTQLRQLELGYNRLVTLPLEITNLQYLNYLAVYRNQIQYIPWQIFAMPDLYISYWGNPGYSGYYYDDYYNDDGFVSFIMSAASFFYDVFSTGWNLTARLGYGDHRFAANLSERAVLGGRENFGIVTNGEFKKHGPRDWWFDVRDVNVTVMEELVGAGEGSLWISVKNTSRGDAIHLSSTARLFDSDWKEIFDQNSTAKMHLTAPENMTCSISGEAATSLVDLHGDLRYLAQKYMVSAGLRHDNESMGFARNFTMPPFFPNLCPLPHGIHKEPQLPPVGLANPTRSPSTAPTSVPTRKPTGVPTVSPSAPPSAAKTPVPTAMPSAGPTASPTAAPTKSPSAAPTAPSRAPTAAPTKAPNSALDPTAHPTVSPTSSPTVVPSAAPSAPPTPIPTAVPSLKPSAAPTRTPTSAPSASPSAEPTVRPSRVPTASPTSAAPTHVPTAAPSTRTPTATPTSARPSAVPSMRPTAMPSSAAPTLDRSAPVISPVDTSVTRSTIELTAHFSQNAVFAGSVYCAAFPVGTSLTSVQQLITASSAQSVGYLAGADSAIVVIPGRSAVTTYATYCVAVTVNGDTGSLAQALSTAEEVTTACCKEVTFLNAPGFVYGATSQYTPAQAAQYVFSYALSSAPGSAVDITPTITDSNDDPVSSSVLAVTPASVSFTSISTNLAGRFILSGSALLSGKYTVTLVRSGASAAEFDSVETAVEVISSATAKPPPSLMMTKFSNSGGTLSLTFDGPSNKAGIIANNFACNQVFNFTDAATASCSWLNGSAVRAVLDPANRLVANTRVYLLAGLVKAECAPADCGSYTAAARQWTLASPPDSPVVPTVLLNAPSLISSCDNVTIDASLSSGSGGRDWTEVTWTVVRADAADGIVPVPEVLAVLNARGMDIRSPIVLSRTLFARATYTVTLTLKNFLDKSSSATAIFAIDGNPNLPIVSILGSTVRTMAPADSLQLYTTTTQASCAERSSSISYMWTVLRNGAPINKPSVSATPSRFSLLSYSLAAGNVYTFVFEATARATDNNNAITGKASTTVQVVNGAVQIVIVGGSKRQVPTSGQVTIDASPSYDENIPKSQPSGLTFAWTCSLASAANFGQSCDAGIMTAGLDQNILTVDATQLDATLQYEFQLVAQAADGRTSSAVVSVQPQFGDSTTYTFITSLVSKVNPDSRVSLNGVVRATYALDCSWSASVDGTDVPLNALTPSSDTFSRVAVRNDFVFPLVVPGNTFLPGSTVTFRLNAHLAGDTQFESFSEIVIKVNAPPNGGTVVVSPPDGKALSTIFTISTAGWTDDPEDFPLTYQFQYQTVSTQPPLGLQSRTPSNKVSSDLPAGPDSTDNTVTLICSVFDAALATATKTASVVVVENIELDVAQYVTDQLSNFDNVGDVNTVGQLIGNVATTVNKVDCSAATAVYCTARNRRACSSTPQTCGGCLPGYRGVNGDANSMCYSTSRRKLVEAEIGEACAADGDCLYGSCVDSLCVAPTKTCPSDTSDECSGHGACEYTTHSGQQLAHVCTVMDFECNAKCHCEDGYGGRTCGMTTAKVLDQDSIRASLCDAVVTVANNSDPSVQLLQSLFGYLDAAFDPFEVVTTGSMTACQDAMTFVSNFVTRNADLLKEMETSQIDVLVKTASKFVLPKAAGDESDGSFIHQLMSTLHVGILGSMVNGQTSYSYATENMRTVVTKAKIGEATSLAPPASGDERYYGGAGIHSYIEVVDDTTSSPFSSSEGYLALAVMLWGSNPFPDADSIQSAMLRVENYNLEEHVARKLAAAEVTGSVEETSSRELAEAPDYYIVLQMNEKQAFDFRYSFEEAQALGLNVTFPQCTNYDGAEYTSCSGCEVSTYTDYNVTFACSVSSSSRRALSESSDAVNQFGAVVAAPSARANSRAPTRSPTQAPGSSSSTNDNMALILGLAVGIGGGVLLVLAAVVAFFLCSRPGSAAQSTFSAVDNVEGGGEAENAAAGGDINIGTVEASAESEESAKNYSAVESSAPAVPVTDMQSAESTGAFAESSASGMTYVIVPSTWREKLKAKEISSLGDVDMDDGEGLVSVDNAREVTLGVEYSRAADNAV